MVPRSRMRAGSRAVDEPPSSQLASSSAGKFADAATANAVGVGLVLALGSHFECVACQDMPAEWFNLALGVWLLCAPFVLEFTRSAVGSANTLVVGGAVAALAVSALSLDKQIVRFWHRAP